MTREDQDKRIVDLYEWTTHQLAVHITELEAKIREWEAWFDALERFDGDEPPKRLEE